MKSRVQAIGATEFFIDDNVFHYSSNLSLELVNSTWKETHVVSNLTLDCMLYSSSVPHRPMRMLMPNLDLVEM